MSQIKKLLPFSNRVFVFLGAIGLGALVFLSISYAQQKGVPEYKIIINSFKQTSDTKAVHPSQYFLQKKLVADLSKKSVARAELSRIYAGVISHHIPTMLPEIVDFYHRIQLQQSDVETFVIVGPNHFNKGIGNIITSRGIFETPFGRVATNDEVITKLEQQGLVVVDESPFDHEHAIDTQTLVISHLFPKATVIPFIINVSTSNKEAARVGEALAAVLPSNSIIVSSVDFSHYIPEEKAKPLDTLSASILADLNSETINRIHADSPQALALMISALHVLKATDHTPLRALNSGDIDFKKDYTTGYVVGYFGKK